MDSAAPMRGEMRVAAGRPGFVIGVAIPVYRHAVLLAEAVESVLAQNFEAPVGIVIVSDGCGHLETHSIAAAYAMTYDNIVYLRQPNGGPSSARNYAIDYMLANWPAMRAVFFLDADNRLPPDALAVAYAALRETPGIGWVYPHITSFGVNWSANYGAPYSPLLHVVHDNICDTGSLVARAVLDAGVRFDEDANSGYEDWDFWLQCLSRGFTGKHAPFGFAYRQRPESRFREINRQRGSMVEHLRRRHHEIAAPRNLLLWEHETNPRFFYRSADAGENRLFTDPARSGAWLSDAAFEEGFYASLQQPDEFLLAPYLAWGSEPAMAELQRLRIINSVFSLAEREAGRNAESAAGRGGFVAVTFEAMEGAIEIAIRPAGPRITEQAMLWLATAGALRAAVADMAPFMAPEEATEICVRGSFAAAPARRMQAFEAMARSINMLRHSRYANTPRRSWNWRPPHFPAREDYYKTACNYLGTSSLTTRLAGGKYEIAFTIPLASYGGSEKAAYAMARFLRDCGAAVHLFIMDKPKLTIIPEFADVFETVNFLADADYPRWGGNLTVFGQECYLPDAAEVKAPEIVGMLCGFDMVINCHSAPLNSVMGSLRAKKIKTATYLHVIDVTPLGRLAGHPYLALGFEHAYDHIFTCSRQLAEDMHGLGVPSEKMIPIQNAAGFSVPAGGQTAVRRRRMRPRKAAKLRAVYIGRLDRQKGVERLLALVTLAVAADLAVEFRIIGSGLLETAEDWGREFTELGVALQPPVHASEALAAVFGWADVLILPSRWEGAPLVIPECQQLGCIPIATDVGAVSELMTHGVDGLLVQSGDDEATAREMLAALELLLGDDALRVKMALAGLARSESNKWEVNLRPVLEVLPWLKQAGKSSVEPLN